MSGLQDEALALAKTATIDEKKSIKESLHNEFVQGSEGVTHEELATLRHVPDSIPIAAYLVAFVEFAERWSYYGTVNIFNNYIRAPLPPGSINGSVDFAHRATGVAGALDQGQQKYFAIRTFNQFFTYTTPLLGGIIADSYWGRYKTIMVFSAVCLAGHILLTATATPQSLENIPGALAGCVVSILIMGLGAGCIKSNVSPLVAEQYNQKLRKETLPSGEVIIRSPALTIQSIYMYFYMAINFGACGAISASFLARDNGFWVAFLVPTTIFALVPGVLLLGKKRYTLTPPRGSILIETFRVIGIAGAGKWSLNPSVTWKRFHADDFWAPALPSSYQDDTRPASITWDDEFVGEVGRTVNACKVFLWFPIFWLCYGQIDGNLTTVAAGMRLDGTPNDLVQNLNPVTLIVLIPIFDKLIYPALRRFGIKFTPIKRITTGFLVVGLAMIWAAVLQNYLYKMSPCQNNRPSACETADKYPNPADINVWVVSGPYILVGVAEIFASITSLEYAFTKSPARMKSVVVAFSQFQTAISAAINFALVSVNVEEKFQWLFTSFAIVTWIVGFIFFFTFRDLDRAEAELNAIGTGNRAGFVDEGQETNA